MNQLLQKILVALAMVWSMGLCVSPTLDRQGVGIILAFGACLSLSHLGFRGGIRKCDLIMVSIPFLYLSVRAFLSPVMSLAAEDLVILSGMVLFFSLGLLLRKSPQMVTLVWDVMSFLIVMNILFGVYQQFDKGLFLRRGDPGIGLSGLFVHKNAMASFVGAASLALMLVSFDQAAVRKWAYRLISLGGFGLVLASLSRGGLFAMMVGAAVIVFLVLAKRFIEHKKSAGIVLLTYTVGVAVLSFLLVGAMFAKRGMSVDSAFLLGDRVPYWSMAWRLIELPHLWGNGSNSYSFQYLTVWSQIGSWLGDLHYIHNEYLQAFLDYGLVGMLLIIGGLTFFFQRLVSLFLSSQQSRGLIQLAATGVLCAYLVQAVFSFNFHFFANTAFFALILGLASGAQNAVAPSKTAGVGLMQLLTLAAGTGLFVSLPHLRALPYRFDRDTKGGGGLLSLNDDLLLMREIAQRDPSFENLRYYGRLEIENYLASSLQGQGKQKKLVELKELYKKAYQANPYDVEIVSNKARIHDWMKEFELAQPLHIKVLELAGMRESVYGPKAHLSQHYYLLALYKWQSLRQPEEALTLFQQSLLLVKASNFGKFKGLPKRKYMIALKKHIQFLEEAGIQPAKIDFGFEAE